MALYVAACASPDLWNTCKRARTFPTDTNVNNTTCLNRDADTYVDRENLYQDGYSFAYICVHNTLINSRRNIYCSFTYPGVTRMIPSGRFPSTKSPKLVPSIALLILLKKPLS